MNAARVSGSPARHVLLMVWDGLRPDLVSPQHTPNLFSLAERGVRFTNSHAVYPTVTRVNAASIATGALPARHGIPSNLFRVPGAPMDAAINTGLATDLERLRRHSGGRILRERTLGERLAAVGHTTTIVSTGSPGSTMLQHPEAAACGDRLIHPDLFVGVDRTEIEARLGPMPTKTLPNTAQNAYVTRIITDVLLPQSPPHYLAFWHCDPDHTQHARGIGHPQTLRSLADADTNLGALLAALDRLGLAGETAVLITSDHGFSTISDRIALARWVAGAGLEHSPESADVAVLSDMVYLAEPDDRHTAAIVAALARQPAVGPIFTGARGAAVVPGTTALAAIGADGPHAPDILFSPAWSDAPNEHGYPGGTWSMSATGANVAGHGSISPWDIRNTLIAAGAGVRRGVVSAVPVGNLDLAPTILRLLGVSGSGGFDGRVIEEALAGEAGGHLPTVEQFELLSEEAGRRQTVRFSRVGSARYLDSGSVER